MWEFHGKGNKKKNSIYLIRSDAKTKQKQKQCQNKQTKKWQDSFQVMFLYGYQDILWLKKKNPIGSTYPIRSDVVKEKTKKKEKKK